MIEIIISDKCNGCGICEKNCPTNVLEVINKRSTPKNIEECMACRLCEVVCPLKGIVVLEK
ncbi:MAG TPA: 4Fe-4S binding protein [Anaerovoracaceae bacterium]|nr:4Fe-4S binding protein [Anaerovoracaceae bacterium]